MTTGRINQVTIIDSEATHGSRRIDRPRRWAWKARIAKRRSDERSTAQVTLPKEGTQAVIHLPPLSSPKSGPPQGYFGPEGRQ